MADEKKMPYESVEVAGMRITIIDKPGTFTNDDGETFPVNVGIKVSGITRYPFRMSAMQLAALGHVKDDPKIKAILTKMLDEEKKAAAEVKL